MVSATLYGSTPVPVAWAGRPIELPDARVLGPAAAFLAPDAQGLRFIRVQPCRRPVPPAAALAPSSCRPPWRARAMAGWATTSCRPALRG
ncbi:MAG: hypothetical protein R2712_29115 [Vicinamibacterales bacterium]